MSIGLIITEIPKYYKVLYPLFCLAERIVVLDVSLLSFEDSRPKIEAFYEYLSRQGLSNKVELVDPIENNAISWKANEQSVEIANSAVASMRGNKSEAFYFGGYIAHKLQFHIAKNLYVREILKQYHDQCDCYWFIGGKGLQIKKKNINIHLFSSLFIIVFSMLLLPFLLLWVSRKTVHISFKKPVIHKGGFCLDLVSGPGQMNGSGLNPDLYGDTCFFESSGLFSHNNFSYLAYGWNNKDNNKWKDLLEDDGAAVFGEKVAAIEVGLLSFVRVVIKNCLVFGSNIFKRNGPDSGWTLRLHLIHLKYIIARFQAQLNFLNHRPSVYLSKLDYNYNHHAIGAVCRQLGIHFSGICHSPLGGTGYTPQMGFISFDSYFCYAPIFWKKYYDSWQNGHTKLIPIGVWRSDFPVTINQRSDFQEKRKIILQSFSTNFLVGLHLPVPNSFLFRKRDVNRWMDEFEKILYEQKDVVFILFPRRLENSPGYFFDWISQLRKTGRVSIVQDFPPEFESSYPWVSICDLIVGCSFSDVVLEALACGKPAISYSDVGQGNVQFEEFDPYFSVYSGQDLGNAIEKAKSGNWPSETVWNQLRKNLVWAADGNSRRRIKAELKQYIKPVCKNI